MIYQHEKSAKRHGRHLFISALLVAALVAGFAWWVGILPVPAAFEGPFMLIVIAALGALQSLLMMVFAIFRLSSGGKWFVYFDAERFEWRQPNGQNTVVKANDILSLDRVEDTTPVNSWYLNTRGGAFGLSTSSGVDFNRLAKVMNENEIKVRTLTLSHGESYFEILERESN